MNRRLFQFNPQSAEFKSKTKTGATANHTSDADPPAHGAELDFHLLAGLQVDAGVEFHTCAAQLRNQSGYNRVSCAGDGDDDRRVHTISGISASIGPVHFATAKHNLLDQAEVQHARRDGHADREQANHSSELEPPKGRLAVLLRGGAQFLHPSQIGLVLRPFPDEGSDTALIVSRERSEAEGLQTLSDGGQHLCTSEHCAGSGQEYQFDLRSLVDGLRERKQTTGD
jgi:hypothetical protein